MKEESQNQKLKKQLAKDLAKELSENKGKTIAFINLRNLPDKILQKTRKKLRDTSKIKAVRKAVLTNALKSLEFPEKLQEFTDVPSAIIITEKSPYDLYHFFENNKGKMAAKEGQIAPFDLVVKQGETNLLPGPALSELKTAKINARIQGGKIVIAGDSVVAKQGEKINGLVAKALQKLEIFPFEVGVNLNVAFDGKYIFTPDILAITTQEVIEDLTSCLTQSINVSVNASYPSCTSIDKLIVEALRQSKNCAVNGRLITEAAIDDVLVVAVREGLILGEKIKEV